MRLCFVADPRSVHTVRWIRYFQRNHEVAIVSAYPPGDDFQVDASYYLSLTARLPGTRVLLNVLELREVLRKFRPDVLHAHYINEAGWLAAFSGFHPFVLTAWGSDVYIAPRISRLARVLNSWAVRRADCVTADSSDQVRALQEMGAARNSTKVVGWGVNLDEFSGRGGRAWREKYGIGEERIVILSPRQWVSNSNIPLILRAFARVNARHPETFLILKARASTPDVVRAQMEFHIRELGISKATQIVNEMAEAELPQLYAAADITVSVGSSDGTPVSILEAMASGSAVVAGDLPSIREWVRHGETGLVVPVGDSEALASELLRLVDGRNLRSELTVRAHRLVADHGSRTRNFERMERIYLRLLDRCAASQV